MIVWNKFLSVDWSKVVYDQFYKSGPDMQDVPLCGDLPYSNDPESEYFYFAGATSALESLKYIIKETIKFLGEEQNLIDGSTKRISLFLVEELVTQLISCFVGDGASFCISTNAAQDVLFLPSTYFINFNEGAPPFTLFPGIQLFPGHLSSPFIGFSDCVLYDGIPLAPQNPYVMVTLKINGLAFSATGGNIGFGTSSGTRDGDDPTAVKKLIDAKDGEEEEEEKSKAIASGIKVWDGFLDIPFPARAGYDAWLSVSLARARPYLCD